jgi:hypothetical protein
MYIVLKEKMMSAVEILFGLALFFVICFVVISILIVLVLDKRNIKTNFLWLRLFLFKYVNQYKKITLAETGKVGSLFYLWILSINLALVCAVAGLFLKVAI